MTCEGGTGWVYCAFGDDLLTVCRCACTCRSQEHCPRLADNAPHVGTVTTYRRWQPEDVTVRNEVL